MLVSMSRQNSGSKRRKSLINDIENTKNNDTEGNHITPTTTNSTQVKHNSSGISYSAVASRPFVVVFCFALVVFSPACSSVVVFCSAVGAFKPVCTTVVFVCSTVGVFKPVYKTPCSTCSALVSCTACTALVICPACVTLATCPACSALAACST
ncbi:hypothetical protein DPX16_18833 [Anabarilius grahami]|uniref:Uncharacterized protein n=1 Tax=Anabarilius grahami TaxID=495550 RepID=A0A3N0Y1Y6_ANAGA|nr:hypothetical protein DPX16_18833 [Anabarilius grahami]